MSHGFARVASFALCLAAFTTTTITDTRPPTFAAREVARIRHHLEGAQALLAQRNLSLLTAQQRAARAERIADLSDYTNRGRFPHNRVLAGYTPVFVDDHGTRCAMAHLIERSGARDLVARIAKTRNLARIRELADDRELVAWLDDNGLTLAEAARIQPQYGSEPTEENVGPTIGVGVAGLTISGIGTIANLSRGTSASSMATRATIGLMAGMTGVATGIACLENPKIQGLGIVGVGLGLVSIGRAVWQLSGPPAEPARAVQLSPASWQAADGTTRVGVVARF